MEIHELMVILGPTASGKTALAVKMADILNAEIISADSRQVYKGLNIGTGKDLCEYENDGKPIKHHLIDILEPEQPYNAFLFKTDAIKAALDIQSRGKLPLICGGTGLYIETLLLDYKFYKASRNEQFRAVAENMSNEELAEGIISLGVELSDEDKCNRHRLIRRLEVLKCESESEKTQDKSLKIGNLHVFGIELPRKIICQKISERLKSRIDNGMIEEVEGLIKSGVSLKWLNSLGLEYRFVSKYLNGEISRDEMFTLLEIAIHQFAKRQATWFRRMEKRGIKINWIDGLALLEEKVEYILEIVDFGLER